MRLVKAIIIGLVSIVLDARAEAPNNESDSTSLAVSTSISQPAAPPSSAPPSSIYSSQSALLSNSSAPTSSGSGSSVAPSTVTSNVPSGSASTVPKSSGSSVVSPAPSASPSSPPPPTLQFTAPNWTRIDQDGKKCGDGWGGLGGAFANSPNRHWAFAMNEQRGYWAETFRYTTFNGTGEWPGAWDAYARLPNVTTIKDVYRCNVMLKTRLTEDIKIELKNDKAFDTPNSDAKWTGQCFKVGG